MRWRWPLPPSVSSVVKDQPQGEGIGAEEYIEYFED